MKSNRIVILSLLLIGSALFSACGDDEKSDQTQGRLDRVHDLLKSSIEEVGNAAAEIAKVPAETGLSSPQTRQALLSIEQQDKHIIDAATVDPSGKIVAIEPSQYREAEGENIAQQAHVSFMLTHKEPILSNFFRSVEGENAIDLQWPIKNESGEFLGAVSFLIEAVGFIEEQVTPELANTPFSFTIQQLDGTVLYDKDPLQVGRNILSDPAFAGYPDLIRQVKETIAEESGSGSYTFTDLTSGSTVKKYCQWTTLKLFNAEWRLVFFWQ